ncbi:MAG: hypothetical protein WC475_01675 [Candidatus Paceibacterota bacterium]|jgi:hypothetical protein
MRKTKYTPRKSGSFSMAEAERFVSPNNSAQDFPDWPDSPDEDELARACDE